MPIDESAAAKCYYKELHSEYRDKLSSLIYIKTVIDTLTQKQIPFIMTYMDELLLDNTKNANVAAIKLQEYVRPYMTKFDGLTFLNWSRANNYPETKMWHPLEQAHLAAGKLIAHSLDTKSINVHCHLS
jgi:hypothetical protein